MGGIRDCLGQQVCSRDGVWSTATRGGGRGEKKIRRSSPANRANWLRLFVLSSIGVGGTRAFFTFYVSHYLDLSQIFGVIGVGGTREFFPFSVICLLDLSHEGLFITSYKGS